jgi:hypothetical protein
MQSHQDGVAVRSQVGARTRERACIEQRVPREQPGGSRVLSTHADTYTQELIKRPSRDVQRRIPIQSIKFSEDTREPLRRAGS